MEVHGRQPDDRRHRSDDLGKADRSRTRDAQRSLESHSLARHEAITNLREAAAKEKAAEASETSTEAIQSKLHQDVIDLSVAAQNLDHEIDPVRAEKVERLARAHREGRLVTPELLERTADRILSS